MSCQVCLVLLGKILRIKLCARMDEKTVEVGWLRKTCGPWSRSLLHPQKSSGLKKEMWLIWSFAFLHRRIGVCRKKTGNFDGFSYDGLGHRVNPISCYFLLPDLLFTQRVCSISITGSASFCINWVVFFTETKEVTYPSAFPVQASGS